MRVIAFYLPQFHEIPENNEWWGEGFTEWTNVKTARPLYSGHYQPREPINDNYYDLLNDDVKEWQVSIAKKNGIYGFCFYHYWFDGKMLLEKPVEQFLKNKNLDINFCLSWANEPWTKAWVSKNDSILIEQNYGNEENWEKHFDYLLPFFKDSRYICNDGKPLFVIYRPEQIGCLNEMLDYWQILAKKNGLAGIDFAYQQNG
ncbi:glycoside hydrolase family 99-like domain-containing protein, partial [Enterococcus faecium]|uniref:glycoside hydrolase family 99-like domain-containing protein n=1 Tax=Enterococcus faecium TaxID=1352 RepID=UPI000FB2454E